MTSPVPLPIGREPAGAKPLVYLLPAEGEVLVHSRLHLIKVATVLEEAAVVVAVLPALELALKVVVAWGAFLVTTGLTAMFDNLLHPPLFGLPGRIDGLKAIAARVVDARGDVIALGLEHVG